MHHGFRNTHLRIAKMHMMINKNMIMFGASSLSMDGSISTPRPSTQPKQYHELKQYKKIKLWYRTKHLKSLQTIIKQLLTFDFWEWSLNGKRGIVSLVNWPGLWSKESLQNTKKQSSNESIAKAAFADRSSEESIENTTKESSKESIAKATCHQDIPRKSQKT